jgi:protease I
MKQNRKIAILATDGFEESELTSPRSAIEQSGATPVLVSLKSGKIKSWKDGQWGEEFEVDMSLETANSDDFDGLMLPGGVINPDLLRKDARALKFVQGFFQENKQKPVAAICHAPATLISAGVVKDRRMTSYDSIKDDLRNAGANWVDEEVVVDKGLVTSRSPSDLKAFNEKMVEEFKEGKHHT